ncbi:hypothetical protein HYX06_00735 [Candidatus Woesearchaeota archaeon]|nr:hypothetical protein [Candidatus Woesearchaeota archaeon]
MDVLVSSCAPAIKGTFTATLPKITFENALADKDNLKGLRQKYLEQLLAESSYGQYAHSVVYDHDGKVVREAALEDIEKIISTQKLAEYHASNYVRYNYRLFNKSDEEKEKKKTYLLSPDGEREFRESLADSIGGTVNALAWCRSLASDIGSKIKPIIYVSGKVFETLEMGVLNLKEKFYLSEDILKAILEHELMHAYDDYSGMDLGNGLKIDSLNVLSLDPKLLNFVFEARAYLHAHEFAKARLGSQTQRFTLFSLFTGEYYNGAHTVDETSLTQFQKQIFKTQQGEVEKAYPEIEKMLKSYKN